MPVTPSPAPRVTPTTRPKRAFRSLVRWVDSNAVEVRTDDPAAFDVEWSRVAPLVVFHLVCLGVFLVGFSWIALAVCAVGYVVRMFAITAFYHRYFSHRSFKTSRVAQFVFAFLGNTAMQRDALWWAAHHRKHHKFSDTPKDSHSPVQRGFWWSHVLWFTTRGNYPTDFDQIRDLARYPELRFLNRCDLFAPVVMALAMYGLGAWLATAAPELGTSGWQMLIWGFFVSTVLLFHGTCSINSLAHMLGRRRFPTTDDSRNSLLLALITLGEGWHNNHHFYPVSTRQGFFWWEIDLSYYGLRVLSWLGIVWDLKPVPDPVRRGHRVPPGRERAA